MVSDYWRLFCTCQSCPSVVSLPFVKGTSATFKTLLLYLEKKRWHFHTTIMGLVMPFCFDRFSYRVGWILSFRQQINCDELFEYYFNSHGVLLYQEHLFIHYLSMSLWNIYFNSGWNLLNIYYIPRPMISN